MQIEKYCVNASIVGAQLGQFYKCAIAFAARGLVVSRGQRAFDEQNNKFIKCISDDIILAEDRTEWPGTVLFRKSAKVYEFCLNSRVADAMALCSSSLYDWVHPRLPEDLAFLRADHSVWMASVSHDREFYFKFREGEREALLTRLPWLDLRFEALSG